MVECLIIRYICIIIKMEQIDMKAVKVQYTVKPEYVEQNKKNIQKVMEELQLHPIAGMHYASYTDSENPNTFIHINMAKDESTMSKLSQIDAFNAFRTALKASEPLSPPKQTTLDLVAAGFEL